MSQKEKKAFEVLKKDEITTEELQQLLAERDEKNPSFLLIDVREREEYSVEKIVGVDLLVPTSEFYLDTSILDEHKNKTIVWQCRSGARSNSMQQILNGFGYKKVINLLGGILDYGGPKD